MVVLSVTMSAKTQEGEPRASVEATAATGAHDEPPAKKPDRVFGVLPNYGTVDDAREASVVTTRATFRMAALNTFNLYAFPFVGATTALAQLENQERSLGPGLRAYWLRYATSFADSSISSFLTSAILPTLLKQDPRYFELREGSGWHRTGYAAPRVTAPTRARHLGMGPAVRIACSWRTARTTAPRSSTRMATVMSASSYR